MCSFAGSSRCTTSRNSMGCRAAYGWHVGGKLLDNTGHLWGSILVMNYPNPPGEIEKEKTSTTTSTSDSLEAFINPLFHSDCTDFLLMSIFVPSIIPLWMHFHIYSYIILCIVSSCLEMPRMNPSPQANRESVAVLQFTNIFIQSDRALCQGEREKISGSRCATLIETNPRSRAAKIAAKGYSTKYCPWVWILMQPTNVRYFDQLTFGSE